MNTGMWPMRHRARIKRDRKSTRLNSSHSHISYAVFCLKKKIKRDHVILIYAVMAQTFMLTFVFYMARRNSDTIDNAGSQMNSQTATQFILHSHHTQVVGLIGKSEIADNVNNSLAQRQVVEAQK